MSYQDTDQELPSELATLTDLLAVDSPTGDEMSMVDFLETLIPQVAPTARLARLGSSLVAVQGEAPAIAVMVHIDTTGFTVGYGGVLIPIGSPSPVQGDRLRPIGDRVNSFDTDIGSRRWALVDGEAIAPGTRMVYASGLSVEDITVTSPYLDNRAGMWAAIEVLRQCTDVAVAFTSGEEVSGHGARVCADHLYNKLGIVSVLISDVTWDTDNVHVGAGPAISLRDASVPNRRFIDRVTDLAGMSGLPFQIEVESDGGSDGAHIEAGSSPIDWAFVGAPEDAAHSSHERMSIDDLTNMAKMLKLLVQGLSEV